MQKFKVALAQFPGGGSSRWETNAYIIRVVRQMDADESISEVVSLSYNDVPIPMLRNRAVLEAKQAKCTHLLMIDNDVWPDVYGGEGFWAQSWRFLRERDPKLPPATVGAPYCGPPPEECVYVFNWATRESDSPNPSFSLEMIPRELAAIKGGIEEVAALPTGLILFDMRVFDGLTHPYFAYEWEDHTQSRKSTTEDVFMTRNASLLGFPMFCNWDCWAAHIKTKAVGKPTVFTRDMVHQSLREAVLRGVDAGDRLIVVGGQGRPPEPPRALIESPRVEVPDDGRI